MIYHKKTYISLIFISFIILCFYSLITFEGNQYTKLPSFIKDPEKHHDEHAVIYGKMIDIKEDEFLFSSDSKEIIIKYKKDIRKTRFGATFVYGRYHKDGFFQAEEIFNADLNHLKYIISFFSLLILLYYLKKEWGFKLNSLAFESKNA